MTATQALPMNPDPRITQAHRIAVGMKRDSGAPKKLDHFLITQYDSQIKSYKVDREAMEALAAYDRFDGDPKKPKRLPIEVYHNLITVEDPVTGEPRLEVPPSILYTRMAFYWGSRCHCCSEGFRPKDKRECERDGIDFPPDTSRREAWIGVARKREFDDNGRVVSEKRVTCNPMRCQLANGTCEMKGYEGKVLCKPQTMLNCALPFLPRLGVAAKFVTTSWQSTEKLRSSLRLIGAHAKGWLAKVPLDLVVTIERVNTQGYTSPIVHVEFAGDMQALRETAVEVKAELAGLDRELARLDSGADPMKALDSGEEARVFSREFAHETADASGTVGADWGIESRLQELADAAGWTDAKLQQELDAAGGDEDAVIAKLEEATGRVQDADFEDPEADYPPSEYEDDTPPPDEPPADEEDAYAGVTDEEVNALFADEEVE